LGPQVKKIRLSIDCINQAYDITEPQPQLFVAESLEHLPAVLTELEQTLSYKKGGLSSLQKALRSETVTTTVFEQALSVSGKLSQILTESDSLSFLKWEGPVQISHQEKELPEQGRERHPHGFSSPMGKWKKFPEQSPSSLSDSDLHRIGLKKNQKCQLEMASGFLIEGTLLNWVRTDNQLCLLQWTDCTVRKGDQVFYEPGWGLFDQVVGEAVISVHAGPADRENYGDYELGKVSTSPGRLSPYSPLENKVSVYYDGLRKMRDEAKASVTDLKKIAGQILSQAPQEWLLNVEILEILQSSLLQAEGSQALALHLKERLQVQYDQSPPAIQDLIQEGLRLAEPPRK
jgi:phenylalanine-4-hydroxylase